jgi:hypothetical protein
MKAKVIKTAFLLLAVMLAAGMISCAATQGGSDGTSSAETAGAAETSGTQETKAETGTSGDDYTVNEPDAVDYSKYQIPVLEKNADGLYVQTFKPYKVYGITTTFQTASGYTSQYRLPSDAVMVYNNNAKSFVSGWADQSGNYEVDLMTALVWGHTEYVNKDDIQTRADGSYFVHTAPDNYYMIPTLAYIEYMKELVGANIDNLHPKTVIFEEPDMFTASGYSQGFKNEWKSYYGTDWEPQTASAGAMYRTMKLKVYLIERLLTEMSKFIKEKAPGTKVYIATHSTVSYNSISITAGINNYLALGCIDGVIGQTWSDTAYNGVPYNGSNINDAYLSGYIEYTSYLDSVEGTDFFALSDPMADNSSFTEKQCRVLYRQTVTASLMNPEIQRFQLFPWPSRSFVAVSGDYKTLQLQVFNALDEVAGKPVTLTAGTPGIYFAISDSVAWQSTNKNWSQNTNASVYGMTLPLVYKGIPTKMKSLEHIKTASDLDGVELLLLSYDCQKPVSEEANKAIAEWIKAGGTLLYIGGHDTYEKSENEWWYTAGGTPLQNLINNLSLDITVTVPSGSNSTLRWVGGDEIDGTAKAVNATKYMISKYRGSYAGFKGADVEPIIKVGDDVIGCQKKVGKGNVIFIGIPSATLAQVSGGANLMCALTKYALESYTDVDYSETSLMTVRRGNIVAAHSITVKNTISGKYIDLFDDKLPVLDTVTVAKNDSVLLYDISGFDLSIPRLGFTGGKLSGDVTETADKTSFSIYGPSDTVASSRILAPKGTYPVSVTATRDGKSINVYRMWDNETSSLLVQVDLTPENALITVTWGKTPVADDPEYEFGYLTVKTNSDNDDKDYLILNTAGVNSGLRFCDKEGQLIYKFDLSNYPEATLTFNIVQNYILEYSLDQKTWTVIADYSKIGAWTDKGDNSASYSVSAGEVGAGNLLYIRLRNTTPSKGWGGSITSFSIRYLKNGG